MRRVILVLLLLAWAVIASGQEEAVPIGSGEPGSPAANPAGKSALPDAPGVTGHKAEKDDGSLAPGEDPENRLGWPLFQHLGADQKRFWTSLGGVADKRNSYVVFPAAGLTGALIASDSWISRQVSTDPAALNRNLNLSNYAVYSMIGATGGAYLWGHLTRNDHLQETGFLSGEAALNSAAITYLLKGLTQRPRPEVGNRNGSFFQGGDSFPSEHSALAWSMASIFAHEYPGSLTKFFAYGLASAVTVSRVTAEQHFSSDVWIGSLLGWYMGRQVYRAHHDPELGGAPWGSSQRVVADKVRNPAYMASPYVPLDSWVYAALERLVSRGYIGSAYLGMRPWTRMQCAQMVAEAQSDARYQAADDSAAAGLVRTLGQEFKDELQRLEGAANSGVSLESMYTRFTGISGPPLRDGYHFGQTMVDDFGRPYGEGFNSYTGASVRAVAGPLAFYVRGEYQQAASVPQVPDNALQQIAITDFRLLNLTSAPAGFSIYSGRYDRFRLLEGTVSLAFDNVQFSFGKQSLWLGPGSSGSMLFSDNAEPVTMLRIDSMSPYRVPLLSKVFGLVRSEYFLGQLSGQQWIFQPPVLYGPSTGRQPFIQGMKTSFKPTPNLEFGLGFSAMFAGPGLPFTWSEFVKSFYSHKANLAQNPGKRFSSFDVSYRLPKLRDRVTAYLDSLVVDEYSPLGSTRPSINPGLLFAQVPRLPNTEIRVEGFNTDHRRDTCCFPGSVYYDLRYLQGYTNQGNLMGSWIGRGGYGGQAMATHWFSPQTKLQLSYRHQEVDREFLGGGRLNNASVSADFHLRNDLTLSPFLQYERWDFPVLSPVGHSDFTASFQMTFSPKFKWR